ncbi:glycosyl transferase [Bifidobacterium aemilianum]|uniref:Glycosyl transferase n=2 Tax=Bifidobacterium aemilianum TaxID=2493120 RepID=A0A366KAX5_9BIFI|nr:glycosyltransferase [Bifidobacterium aemilianum]RBP98517.1 glycosyl transferase [Bifidobacterium aemilianum]
MADGGAQQPLTIVLVVDTIGNQGNGTSNSALQYARELSKQGHEVRLVGVGAPEYPAEINRVPLVSWVAAKQQMQFARPSSVLFRRAFKGADVVHIYMPFAFGRKAYAVARSMGIPVTAGFHLQPENITYSAGPLKYLPGLSSFIYWLFKHWLYGKVEHIHTPTQMMADELARHGYRARIHVISNGYSPRFSPKEAARDKASSRVGAGGHFRIIASGRLTNEKDHATLIRAVSLCRHARQIELTICGTGPLKRQLQASAKKLLTCPASIGFHKNENMPRLLRSCDLLAHPSIADSESLSVIEGMASGLVPIIADSPLSAAKQFALTPSSLFPVRDAQALANRIDWWIDHPEELAAWGMRYARSARDQYSVKACVRKFVAMERQAIENEQDGSQPMAGC